MAAWISPLILGALLGIGALILLLGGLRSLKHADPKPGSWRTVRSVQALRAGSDSHAAEKTRTPASASSKRTAHPEGKG
jgi:hypothetical protein